MFAARGGFLSQPLAVSGRGLTVTVNGDAQVDTSRSRFGGGSLLLDGVDDYLTVDLDTSGQTEFTWECFFQVDVDAGSGTVAILSNRFGGYDSGEIQMLFRNFDMKIQVGANGGTSSFAAAPAGPALATDTWHHFVFARGANNDVAVWVNGSRVANGNWDGTVSQSNEFGIGAHADGAIEANAGTNAWIDEVRISDTDRYGVSNTSITVPTAEFVNDSNTLLLLHMNGADGSTVFEDDD